MWLTLGALPYAYLWGLYAVYETAFFCMSCATGEGGEKLGWQELALVLGLGTHARAVAEFTGQWFHHLRETKSLSEARQVVKEFRVEWEEKDAAQEQTDA